MLEIQVNTLKQELDFKKLADYQKEQNREALNQSETAILNQSVQL